MSWVTELRALQEQYSNGGLILARVLNESWRRRATEPRDKIFGVMGLFPLPPISVDYSQTPEEVCRAATLACILGRKILLLSPLYARHPSTKEFIRSSPSTGRIWNIQSPESLSGLCHGYYVCPTIQIPTSCKNLHQNSCALLCSTYRTRPSKN